MKYEVTFTYTARLTDEDGHKKDEKSFIFVGIVSGQALPRVGEEFYLDSRQEGDDDCHLVKMVQHRPVKGIVHHSIILEPDVCITDWDMDNENYWVREELAPLMKKQGFVPKK